MDALYINDIDQDIVKSNYIQNTYKLGIKNVKVMNINQHKNAMCQMQMPWKGFKPCSPWLFLFHLHQKGNIQYFQTKN